MTARVGHAVGTFDLFHVGHLNILRHAREHRDFLIAGVVSDEMLRQVKGVEPVIATAERAEIPGHVSFVHEVYVENVPEKLDVWREVKLWLPSPPDGEWLGTALPLTANRCTRRPEADKHEDCPHRNSRCSCQLRRV